MDDFESFTREKIGRLRAEADALEKSLKEFMGTKARVAGAARRSGPDQPRSGAFGVVMDAIANAGPDGLSLDDMIEAAEGEGYEVKRTTLRAQVWKAKEDGALTQIEPGRYRSSVHDAFAGVKADRLDDALAVATVLRDKAELMAAGPARPIRRPITQALPEEIRRVPNILDELIGPGPKPDLDDEIPF